MIPVPKPMPKKKRNKAQSHRAACARYKKGFIKKHGFLFCELNENHKLGIVFSVHHIYSTGQYGWHDEIDNSRNLIFLCGSCHNGMHFKCSEEDIPKFREVTKILIKDRGLEKLFGEKK